MLILLPIFLVGCPTVDIKPEAKKNYTLSGTIFSDGGRPLAGVKVALVDFDLVTTTNEFGKYSFIHESRHQQTVTLIAIKEGYKPYNTYAVMGNPSHSFVMEKEKVKGGE